MPGRQPQRALKPQTSSQVAHENSRMSPRNGIPFIAEWGNLCCRMFSLHRDPEGKRRLMLRDKKGQSKGLVAEDQTGASHAVLTYELQCSLHSVPWSSANPSEFGHTSTQRCPKGWNDVSTS